MLTASGLTYTYPSAPTSAAGTPRAPAIAGIDLTVRAGERVAILGANGSGKSTVLQALSGDLDAGPVQVPSHIAVPQNPDLSLFCATVADELGYGATARGIDPGPVVARLAGALSLTKWLDRPPQALSRGQRLRVAVGAALACGPQVLLLDEPTSGQDLDQVERLMRALGQYPNLAVVFATHDVDLALRHSTRLVVLDGGRVVDSGPPMQVLGRTRLGLRYAALAAWCVDHGVPPGTPAQLAARVS